MNRLVPIVGAWYRRTNGDLFEVVAVDPEEDAIEIQYFDATLEEFDQETWEAQELTETDAPEDWTGSLDVDDEDIENEAETPLNTTWSAPSEFIDRSEASGYSEWPQPVADSRR